MSKAAGTMIRRKTTRAAKVSVEVATDPVEPVPGKTKCLTCDFVETPEKKLKARGLCARCKRAAERSIKAKLTTEKEAIELGLMLPKESKTTWAMKLKESKKLAKKKPA